MVRTDHIISLSRSLNPVASPPVRESLAFSGWDIGTGFLTTRLGKEDWVDLGLTQRGSGLEYTRQKRAACEQSVSQQEVKP